MNNFALSHTLEIPTRAAANSNHEQNQGILARQRYLHPCRTFYQSLLVWSVYSLAEKRSAFLSSRRVTLENLIVQLEQTRGHLSSVLRQLCREAASHNLAAVVEAIYTAPGVAFITTMTLVTEIIDVRRFSRFEHLCSFVELVPSVYSSGETSYTRGMSFRHNQYLRPLLIEAAWTAFRKDPALTLRFNEL